MVNWTYIRPCSKGIILFNRPASNITCRFKILMMKKFLISLLMLLLSWCMFPQTYHKVTYSKVFNGDTIQSFLVFNSKQALSFRKKTERHHENKTKIVYNQSGDPKLNVHKKDNLHYDYSIDLGGSIRLNKKFEDSLFYSVPKSRKK